MPTPRRIQERRTKAKQAAAKSELQPNVMPESKALLLNLRDRLGLVRRDFAEVLGVSLRSVARYSSGRDPIPLPVIRKLRDLAVQQNYTDLAAHFESLLQTAIEARTGFPTTFTAKAQLEAQKVKALETFIELWQVFQPKLTPAEQRIRTRLDELLNEISGKPLPAAEGARQMRKGKEE